MVSFTPAKDDSNCAADLIEYAPTAIIGRVSPIVIALPDAMYVSAFAAALRSVAKLGSGQCSLYLACVHLFQFELIFLQLAFGEFDIATESQILAVVDFTIGKGFINIALSGSELYEPLGGLAYLLPEYHLLL